MKLSRETTVISPDKLINYVLNLHHNEGGSKALFLREIGYNQSNWEILENDLREQHLKSEATPGKSSPFGQKFEITAPIIGPNGEERMIKTIWMIKNNETFARFITLIPEKKQ